VGGYLNAFSGGICRLAGVEFLTNGSGFGIAAARSSSSRSAAEEFISVRSDGTEGPHPSPVTGYFQWWPAI
jgi:hypothetical protein